MPLTLSTDYMERVALSGDNSDARLINKMRASLLLLMQEISREIVERILEEKNPIPMGSMVSWSQKLKAGQLADGNASAIAGYNFATNLLRDQGINTEEITSDSAMGFIFLAEDIEQYFSQMSKRQADTYRRKANTVWSKEKDKTDKEGNLVNPTSALLASAVGEELSKFNQTYSNMVAQSGVVWANRHGQVKKYYQAGKTRLIWHTRRDELVCPYCAELDGMVVGMGEYFVEANSQLEGKKVGADGKESSVFLKIPEWGILQPPLHPWCRCFIFGID